MKKRLKRTGTRTHPCFTPSVILNGSDASHQKELVQSCHLGTGRLGLQASLGTLALAGLPKMLHFLVDSVKCLGQVYEDSVQIHVLLSAFLLDLSDSEDHVNCAATRTKST